MKTTIKDIARECGISAAAVSMALSDKPSRISSKTKEKVRETAKRMNYQQNQAAVSLATRKSRKIGIVINDLTNPHIAALFMSINKEIQKRGYLLLCYILGDGEEKHTLQKLQRALSNDIAGIIWGKPIDEQEKKELKKLMDGLELPVIAIDESDFECPGADIIYDYKKAGYLAVRHLIELGHKRIGCVSGTENFKVTQDRIKGYRMALEEAGIEFSEELIYKGNYTMDSGEKSLAYLLGQKVTAVFAMNDEMAFGIYQSARKYGIRIPEDISVIGCDNVPFGDVLEVPLSTMNVPTKEMGKLIGQVMVESIQSWGTGADAKKERKKMYYQPVLLVKGSTIRIENTFQK